jgi:hypothetical protein
VKRNLPTRLLWSALPSLAGLLLPALLAYWVVSHRFALSTQDWLQALVLAYEDPSDSLVEPHKWLLPPFVVLSVACFIASATASRRRLVVLLVSGLVLVCLPHIPATVRTFDQTYLGNNAPLFLDLVHLGTSFFSSYLLAVGLCLFFIKHKQRPAQ